MRKLSKNNTTLTESINTNLILPTQNKTDFINSGHHEKENKDLNLSRKIEPLGTISSSNPKMRDPEKNEKRNKPRRHIYINGDSVEKHITGHGISKNGQVQVKTHPGTTTDDIIDYNYPSKARYRYYPFWNESPNQRCEHSSHRRKNKIVLA